MHACHPSYNIVHIACCYYIQGLLQHQQQRNGCHGYLNVKLHPIQLLVDGWPVLLRLGLYTCSELTCKCASYYYLTCRGGGSPGQFFFCSWIIKWAMLDHTKFTKMPFWMIQIAKDEVFGHFLELGASYRLQIAYYDYTNWSWQVGYHIAHAGSFKNHKKCLFEWSK